MFHGEVLEKLREEISGKRIREYIYRFWVYDRLSTFPAFHRAAEEAAGLLRELGLSQVEILKYPSRGSNFFADWEAPQGWDARSGVLEAKDPEGGVRLIADRQADPCHLFVWCGCTVPEGVHTQIVRADTEGGIKGKLVFQDKVELDTKLRQRLIDGGALGVISDELPYWPGVRERGENLDLVRWQNAFFYPANRENLLGFQITPSSGDWLRSLLDKHGQVEAFARVETRLYEDKVNVTTGVVPGTEEPEKEVWFIQHLHEVGAHDNASGSACAMELARAIVDLVKKGKLAPPKRTIRLLFSWEIIGFLGYLTAKPNCTRRVICGMNPDMVGPDQELCRSWLQFYENPHSNVSFAEVLGEDLVRLVYKSHPRWAWKTEPFLVNDNFVADPLIGVPCPGVIFIRDRHYHTSSDTPANLSPEAMAEMSALMGSYAYTVTNGGARSGVELAELIFQRAARELSELAQQQTDSASYDEKVTYLRLLTVKRLKSLEKLAFGSAEAKEVRGQAAQVRRRLEKIAAASRPSGPKFSRTASTKIERRADSMVPVRKMIGTLSLGRVPEEVKKERKLKDIRWSAEDNAPWFWADGKRSVFEIQWLAGQEFGKKHDLGELIRFFETLAEYGYVTNRKR